MDQMKKRVSPSPARKRQTLPVPGTREYLDALARGADLSGLLTARQRAILAEMLEHEHGFDGEIVADKRRGYLGLRSVSRAMIDSLLRLCAISSDSFTDRALERYQINWIGKKLLEVPRSFERPELRKKRK